MSGFPFEEYLGNNSAQRPTSEPQPAVRPSMSPALEWALRHKHAEAGNIITNLPNGTGPPVAGIDLRRTANDIKKKEKKEVEIDHGFFIKYLPFLLILAVVLYFFFMMDNGGKSIKGTDSIYKPNEALLYARNIACEVQPR